MPRIHSTSDPYGGRRTNGRYESMTAAINERVATFSAVGRQVQDWYTSQSAISKILLQLAGLAGVVLAVLALIYHRYLIHALVYLADQWLQLRFGRLLLFSLIFFVGFPPLLGFSALSMLAGMVYGFPYGWPLLATATVSGSFCSFLLFRYVLHDQAVNLIRKNEKFRAFSEILNEDQSLFLLILLRLCPLPYSLSNGALAAIPDLPATTFLLASIITSPKLMIHIFVGHKLKQLGDESSPHSTKLVDTLSILITGLAAAITSYVIYSKMQAKLDSYHRNNATNPENYDRMVFGNFEDDLESGQNVELDAADFDADNFIIGDDDEAADAVIHQDIELDQGKAANTRDY